MLEPELRAIGYKLPRAKPRVFAPIPPKRERKGKPSRQTPEQSREYRLAKRARWLLAGIVQPKNDAERAWLAERADKRLPGRAA